MSHFVVIGAGLAGASTAWHLTMRGHEVTVLERSDPANHEGSSHGSARIFRYAYPSKLYTDLVVRARIDWDELEQASGERLVTSTGCLDYGALRSAAALAGVLAGSGVEHELWSSTEAEGRYPQMRFDSEVLWHPGAGVLDAEGAVRAMLRLAVASGLGRVELRWPVSRIEPLPSGYRVHSNDGRTVQAARVIVAAGGWLPALLSELSLPTSFLNRFPPLKVSQEQAMHFPYRDLETGSGPAWPTFIYKGPEIQVYGLPGGRDAAFRGQKIAEYNGGRPLASALDQDGVIEPARTDRVREFTERALPGLDPVPYAETTCLFTSTPTEDFVFDQADGVSIISACSGHGAKFAPLLGRLAADLALDGGGVPDEFRVERHAQKAAA